YLQQMPGEITVGPPVGGTDDYEPWAVSATDDPATMMFTDLRSDAFGVGFITNANKTVADMVVTYMPFNLGETRIPPMSGTQEFFDQRRRLNDSFDVNNADSIAYLPVRRLSDLSPAQLISPLNNPVPSALPITLGYAFIMGRNNPGPSTDHDPGSPNRLAGSPAGSAIGIARLEFQAELVLREIPLPRTLMKGVLGPARVKRIIEPARSAAGSYRGTYFLDLLGATRPLPYGFGAELSLTNDHKFLMASYPTLGMVMAYGVDAILAQIKDPINGDDPSGEQTTFSNNNLL